MDFCPNCNSIYEITKFMDKNNNNKLTYSYLCNNCGNTNPIKPESIVYTRYSPSITQNYNIHHVNKMHDPTYLNTRNYICPNNKCLSHNDPQYREAVFFRNNKNTYLITYICKHCKTSWNF